MQGSFQATHRIYVQGPFERDLYKDLMDTASPKIGHDAPVNANVQARATWYPRAVKKNIGIPKA